MATRTPTVRVIRPATPYGQDTAHSSAPSICLSQSGRLFMLYRQGTDHYISRDGVFQLTSSENVGRTWTDPRTVLDLRPTWDLQGQGLAEAADGSVLRMTYFKASSAISAAGVFLRTSADQGRTWSAERRIDTLAIGATTDVVVELEDGSLLLGLYGRATSAETQDSVFVARSTDRGTTWTVTRLNNGHADGRAYQEPVLAVRGNTVVLAFRWGSIDSIATTVSTDGGQTWAPPAVRFAGSGKPHVFRATPQAVACIYRELNTGHAIVRTSQDNGETWTPARLVHPTYYPSGWMLYSSSTPLDARRHLIAFAEERGAPPATPGVSRLYLTASTEAGAVAPWGTVPDPITDAHAGTEDSMFATRFEQPDGSVLAPWTAVTHNNGSTIPVVTGGELTPVGVSTRTLARVFVNRLGDADIEADLFTAPGSGSSVGIVFRMVSAGTYLLAAAEDTAFRLYGYVDGALIGNSYLATAANPHVYGAWNTHRVIVRGSRIVCFYNDVPVLQYSLSAGNAATFANGFYHGVQLNGSTANSHRCRRFTVRR